MDKKIWIKTSERNGIKSIFFGIVGVLLFFTIFASIFFIDSYVDPFFLITIEFTEIICSVLAIYFSFKSKMSIKRIIGLILGISSILFPLLLYLFLRSFANSP